MLTQTPAENKRADLLLIGVAYLSFIILGIPGTLMNIAWSPYVRETFALPLDAVGVLFITSTIGYSGASFLCGRVIARLGFGWLVILGAVMAMTALVGYALSPVWVGIVLLATVLGASGGLLDAGFNIYFAAHYGPRLMNWLHACFGIGATIAPLLMTELLRAGQSWRTGYLLSAVVYGGLTIVFLIMRTRWRSLKVQPTVSGSSGRMPLGITLRMPLVWLGMALFFVYGGVEFTPSQWAYPLFTESRGIDPATAGTWVSLYWGFFTAGRILFGFIVNRLSVTGLLRGSMLGAVVGGGLIMANISGEISFIGLILIGFAISPIFALLLNITQEKLGPDHAPNAIGFQVAATSLGIALLPGLAGVLGQNFGLESIPPFVIVIALVMFGLQELMIRPRPVLQAAPVE